MILLYFTVVTMGNGVSRTVQQSENSASTKESEEIPLISENQQVSGYSWFKFGVQCFCGAISRTDALL